MGRQFQVYLLPTDVIRLIEILRQEVGLRLLASQSPGQQPIEAESPVQTDAGFTRVDCLLVPDGSISIRLNHLEKQDRWSVDTLFSEVIEFSGCHFDEKTLKRGRFFYDAGFYDGEKWHEKSPSFLLWAEAVFKTVKKSLNRIPSLDAYVGNDAEQWRSAGGTFIALAIAGKTPIVDK